MKKMTLGNIARICGGTLYGEPDNYTTEVSGITLDSRKAEKNFLFIATRGERVDGHSFIPEVMKKGAACALGEEKMDLGIHPYIQVRDSFQALKELAEFYRRQFAVPVVGITGSVGKTSTKEFIASVLSRKFNTLKTEGNFNNEVGLPLTIFRLKEEHQAAVLEMGISNFGEMHRLSKIARPDICVFTNIGQCHLENLKDREGVLQAKTEMFDYMNDAGYVCINGDDDMLATIECVKNRQPITYGMSSKNMIYADQVVNKGLFGSSAMIHTKEGAFGADIPLPGEHMIYNALAATAVGLELGLKLEQIQAGIAAVEAVTGRSNLIKTKNYVVIDDCYNANPVSMRAAIDLLNTAIGKKTAILGDMFELGEKERRLHGEVGTYAAQKGIDRIICVGKISREMYRQAVKAAEGSGQEILYFETREELLERLDRESLKEHTILVKASHGMGFEEVVKTYVNE